MQLQKNARREVNDRLDAEATALARRAVKRPELEPRVRGRLAALVREARVAEQVVYGRQRMTGQLARDMLYEVTGDIDRKIGGVRETSRSHSTLDLTRIASGCSLIGWARQMMRMTVRSKYRDYRARSRRQAVFTSLAGDGDAGALVPYRVAAATAVDGDTLTEDILLGRALRPFDRALKETGRRPGDLTHLAAVGLLDHLGVAGRPVVSIAGRAETARLLRWRPSLPFESLAAWVRLATGDGDGADLPDAVLGFWDGFTVTEARQLAERGPKVAALVMRGFTAGALRPTPDQWEAVLSALRTLTPDRLEGVVATALDGVIETHCGRLRSDGVRLPAQAVSTIDDDAAYRSLRLMRSHGLTTVDAVEGQIVDVVARVTGIRLR